MVRLDASVFNLVNKTKTIVDTRLKVHKILPQATA